MQCEGKYDRLVEMTYHSPSHHPEFPKEKGKILPPELKKILTTVRSVVIGILDDADAVKLNKKTTVRLPDIQKNPEKSKELIKKSAHDALRLVGVNSKKRFDTAIGTLGKQYAHMSSERFFHRLANGKVERDCRFLFGILYHIGQIGPEGIGEVIDMVTSKSNHMNLVEKSPAIKSLKSLLLTAKLAMKEKYPEKMERKNEYEQFINKIK